MDSRSINSSNLAALGSGSFSSALEIEFLNGAVYQYFDVPEFILQGLMAESSHGSYSGVHIRNTYKIMKL